jgi:2-(1,2-epoxy-1,2-dihydrophenyl)acetyl-CoA isomerase
MSESEPVVVTDRRGPQLWLELNRPERLNAMNGELMALLRQRLQEAADDPEVRCVVLTGRGRAFCAGGDSRRLARRPEAVDEVAGHYDGRVRELKILQESSLLLFTMGKPTIALINGAAVGGGLALALACDLRLAASDARLGFGHVRMGISTDFGASYLLQQIVGTAKARELLFRAQMLDADAAHEQGLVTEVVDPSRLLEEGGQLADELAAGPTVAFGRIKENLHLAGHASFREALDREAENARMAGLYRDAAEGVRAFEEKREPDFEGR